MARLSIEIPEDLRAKAAARATESGHTSIEQYVEALLRADVDRADGDQDGDEDFGAPPHLTIHSSTDLEAKLLEGLKTPATEMTQADWDELRRKVVERRAQ